MAKEIELNVFYHDKNKLDAAIKAEDFGNAFNFVNLNDITLPEYLIIPELGENLNKAIFSEYLGILTHSPCSEMVGCFTYSIQLKFSAQWSIESGNSRFLPSINLADIDLIPFSKTNLYAVELTSPRHLIAEEMQRLKEAFPLSNCDKEGPFKGSFVIRKKVFLELQNWLADVTKWMLKEFGMHDITEVHSPFDKSSVSNRSTEELAIDRLRHTYGSILERAVAYFLASQYSTEDTKLIGHEIIKVKRSRAFEQACMQIADEQDIVISFGNYAYRKVAIAWLNKLRRAGVENYMFISMDEDLFKLLNQEGFNTVLNKFEGSLSDLWIFRLKVISRLLTIGLNVIHSDSDAFWLQNPIPELRAIPSDIISSQGTIFPPDCLEQWGFVLCCGFQYFRARAHTLAFFEQLLPLVEKVKDDQKAINQLLLIQRVNWGNIVASYKLSVNDKQFDCYTANINGRTANGLNVTVLPHCKYQRVFESNASNPLILHLLSDKTQDAKLASLKRIEEQLESKNNDKKQVIWLASYPRSGNTLTRSIFKHNFGIHTYSLYNDKSDIGKYEEIRAFVGHKDGKWGFTIGSTQAQQIPAYPEKIFAVKDVGPIIIKTHSQYHEYYRDFKVIYVIREPRSVLTSYVSYKKNFTANPADGDQLLNELIFDGDPMSGFWSEHIEGWLSNKRENILILKYEDIIGNFSVVLDQISDFIDKKPINRELADFSEFQKANSLFFRKGKKDSWRDSLPNIFQDKILASSQNQLRQYAYSRSVEQNNARPSIQNIGPKQPGQWVYVCTPVFNAVNTIDQTIQSVISQAGVFFLHYHIQDGGSTDGTIEKIKSWSLIIDMHPELVNCSSLTFSYESAADSGMYDALSKGFERLQVTKNALMTWINADDILVPGAISTISKIFKEHPNESWIIPSTFTVGVNSEHRGIGASYHPSTPQQIANGSCNGNKVAFIQQEGSFFKSDLWFAVGGLNSDLKLAGDWDLWRRMALVTNPLYTSYKLGVFRKRPGQLGSNTSGYASEINDILKLHNDTLNLPHLNTKRTLSLNPSNGTYEVSSPATEVQATPVVPRDSHNKKISNRSQTRYALSSDIKDALQRFHSTGLGSYALRAARLAISEPIDEESKAILKDHFKENRFKAIVSLIEYL